MIVKQIDEKTRIICGWCFSELGVSYRLQRKGKFFWIRTAWTYATTQKNSGIKEIEDYLFWYEKRFSKRSHSKEEIKQLWTIK